MTTFTVPGIAAGIPDAPDGGRWHAALAHDDGSVTFGQSLTDLVATIIDGYEPDGSSAEGVRLALDARYDFAVGAADQRQAVLAFVATQEGDFDPELVSEDTLTALFTSRDEFVADFASWDSAVPLVLVTSDYEPYADRRAPEGNIEWVDPSTELSLLQSLADAGAFELWILADA